MVSVLINDSSDLSFFPPGSLESQKDSLGTAEFPSFHVLSPKEESSSSKNIIEYIEAVNKSERKLTPKIRIVKASDESRTPVEKTQKFSKRDKELWNESCLLNESPTEVNEMQKEISLLKMQLRNYQELVCEYESSLKVIKSILDGAKRMNFNAWKIIPAFDDSSIRSARQSLEAISLYISNSLVEKSIKNSIFNEPKRIKCLKLDNVYPSILLPESPEPPKQANIIRRQNSIAGKEKVYEPESDKKRPKVAQEVIFAQKNFKSVSPILKTKYKSLAPKQCKN